VAPGTITAFENVRVVSSFHVSALAVIVHSKAAMATAEAVNSIRFMGSSSEGEVCKPAAAFDTDRRTGADAERASVTMSSAVTTDRETDAIAHVDGGCRDRQREQVATRVASGGTFLADASIAVRTRASTALAVALALLGSGGPCAASPQTSERATADPAPTVADLRLKGVKSVDESELRQALSTKESPWLPWRQKQYFDRDVFEADLRRIESFYAEHGYPHARVVDTNVIRRGNAVSATITIVEGDPERIANVQFTGFDDLGERRLRELEQDAPLRAGMPLSETDATTTAQLAAQALGDLGYPYPRVEVRKTPVADDRVSVNVHADPGPLGYFGPITISGNTTIADDVIRRELAYLPGQRFRTYAMQETQRRLSSLGLFESVSIEIAGTDQAGAVPTRIAVKEADLNQITYSFGYGTEEQLNAEGQWRHLNFLGGGRTATVRGRWSSIDRGGEGGFAQPFFLAPRLSLQVTGHTWQIDEPSYESWFAGGGASVSYARGVHDHWGVGYVQEFERSRLSDGLLGNATSPLERDGLGVDSNDGTQSGTLAQVAVDYSRDTTVDPLSPRRGYRASARVEKAGGWLPGAFAYYNVLTTARYYRGLHRITVAGRVQAGFITAQDGSPLPFAKRYFLGGADTLRGWGRLEVSPLSQSGAPIGGSSMLLMSAELRVPIVPRVLAVLFADGGNVWDGHWEIRLDDLRGDIGGGIRIDSPFGPLRLDMGYQMTPVAGLRVDGDPQSRRWRLHFSAGQAF